MATNGGPGAGEVDVPLCGALGPDKTPLIPHGPAAVTTTALDTSDGFQRLVQLDIPLLAHGSDWIYQVVMRFPESEGALTLDGRHVSPAPGAA